MGEKTELLFYFQTLALVLLNDLDVDKEVYQCDSPNKIIGLPGISQDISSSNIRRLYDCKSSSIALG